MHLQRIRAQNFRAFGDGKTAPHLDWTLSKGLNILIGENDAGKTAVVDAIRHVLWTTSYEFVRLFEQDFHIKGDTRTQSMFIEVTLADLSADQEATVLEWLTYEADGSRALIVHLQARWIPPKDGKRGRVDVITRTGRDGNVSVWPYHLDGDLQLRPTQASSDAATALRAGSCAASAVAGERHAGKPRVHARSCVRTARGS